MFCVPEPEPNPEPEPEPEPHQAADGRVYQGEWRDDKPGGLRAAEAGGAVRDASRPLYVEGLGLVRNASAAAVGGGEANGDAAGNAGGDVGGDAGGDAVAQSSGSGQGECTYPDGAFYEGEWLLGKRHGVGTHVSAHGDAYRGGWQRDQRHGNGTLTRN